jgi:hypothetical protein
MATLKEKLEFLMVFEKCVNARRGNFLPKNWKESVKKEKGIRRKTEKMEEMLFSF